MAEALAPDQLWPPYASDPDDESRWEAWVMTEAMWWGWQRLTAEQLQAHAPAIRQAAALARPLEEREADAPPRRQGQRQRFDLSGTPSRQVPFSLARLARARALALSA